MQSSSPFLRKWGPPALAVSITIGLRLALAWVFGAEVADLTLYRQMANIVLRGDNIYYTPVLFPYTPVSLFVPAWCLQLAQFTGLPFHLTMKLPAILGDAGIVLILYWQATKVGQTRRAFLLALAYALNPVSILITAFHGNIMALVVFFCLWAYVLAALDRDGRYYRLSALSLGMAIGLRSFPLLLAPFFLSKMSLTWRQRFVYVALAALPSVVTLLPYLAVSFQDVLREAFGYSGFGDHGWLAVARAYWYVQTESIWLPGRMGQDWLANSKVIFLALYGALVLWCWWKPQRTSLIGWIIAALMLFYVAYGGVSSQYLIWVVPLGIVALDWWALAFTLAATGSLVSFYLFFFPAILWGPFPSTLTYTQPQMMQVHLVLLVIFWLVCLGWFIRALWRSPHDINPNAESTNERVPRTLGASPPALRTRPSVGLVRIATAAILLYVLLVVGLEVRQIVQERALERLEVQKIWQMGAKGSAPGQVDGALGLAVDTSGNVYVADMGNHRVQKIAADGRWIAQWTAAGPGIEPFNQPSDVALTADGNYLWVIDAGSGWLYRFNLEGELAAAVNIARYGVFSPRGLAVDINENLYVADTGNGRVLKLDATGKLQAQWGKRGSSPGEYLDPLGIIVDGNALYVADTGNRRVQKLTLDGRPLGQWPVSGGVSHLATDGRGRLYVSDSQNSQIWVLTTDGNSVGRIGGQEGVVTICRSPRGLAVDKENGLWIVGESQLAHYRLVRK
jgi:DNA-binding beta-propeller fold protein YncE